jgi:hypothetical protein
MICGYEGRLWEGMRGGDRSVHFFLKRAFTSCVYPSHRTHKRHVFAILAVILMLKSIKKTLILNENDEKKLCDINGFRIYLYVNNA